MSPQAKSATQNENASKLYVWLRKRTTPLSECMSILIYLMPRFPNPEQEKNQGMNGIWFGFYPTTRRRKRALGEKEDAMISKKNGS